MSLNITYILKCNDGTFYTGSTNNLEKRLLQHNNNKSGARYTKIRRPVELVYFEEFEILNEARIRENQIKKLSRKQKIELIENKSKT
ncbi:MAG: GIY-YIG nuclease family protein [Candidatus Gracilibacteria bacterium]|nr:GIY-YIG nuclease family protein [Candidatus Gracilibacteria bacterium]